MSRIVSTHNKNILNDAPKSSKEKRTHNCRNKSTCPLDGTCLEESVIYKCHVKKSENDEGIHYIGLTGGTFKDRWAGKDMKKLQNQLSFPNISEN